MDSKIEPIIKFLASDAKIQEPNIVCTHETGKGDGYMGIVKMFEITDKKQTKEKPSESLNIIVKLSPLSDEIHNRLPVREIFLTEILFYTKIAKAMTEFQKEEKVNCFQFVKCFYSDDKLRNEILILDNIQPNGFNVLDRVMPMKHEHMLMAFKDLARLHALSFVIKHKNPQLYQELAGTLYANDNILYRLYKRMGFDNFMRKLSSNCKFLFEGTEFYETFSKFTERIAEEFAQSNVPDEYSVILHGDAWCNNILYKHDESGKPIASMWIDYQLSKVLSPVLDLSYLFYGCADISLLKDLKMYLKAYHDSMKWALQQFQLDIEKIYPFSKLMEHWQVYSKFGFVTSFLMRIIMLSTSEESPDLSQASKNDGDVMMAFMYKMKREKEYNTTIKAIVEHYIKEKYIF